MEELQSENTGVCAAVAQVLSLERWLLLIYRHKSNTGTKYPWQQCPGVYRTAPNGHWGCDHHLRLCISMYHQFCCRIEGFSTASSKCCPLCKGAASLRQPKIHVWNICMEYEFRSFLFLAARLGGRGGKGQQGGKEPSIQGKAFVYFGGNRKKYNLIPSDMYWKICGNQSGRSYKRQEFTTVPDSPAFKQLLCIQDLLLNL